MVRISLFVSQPSDLRQAKSSGDNTGIFPVGLKSTAWGASHRTKPFAARDRSISGRFNVLAMVLCRLKIGPCAPRLAGRAWHHYRCFASDARACHREPKKVRL